MKKPLAFIGLGLIALPFAVFAQATNVNYQFQRDGIFSCNRSNQYSQSVGTQVAIQGVYVPVNDAAVTLNTGILVYKECILREVINRMREASLSGVDRQMQVLFTTGRNGKPLFYRNAEEQTEVVDQSVLKDLEGRALKTLRPEFQNTVKRAIAQGYVASRQGITPYSCQYTGDINSVLKGHPEGSIWEALFAVATPGCDPLRAYQLSNDEVMLRASGALDEMLRKLDWGRGVYSVETLDEFGNPVVNTPGSIVLENEVLTLQSGYIQQRQANDIGQMVGSLYTGIANQIVSDTRGILGLLQSSSGQPSYLDRLSAESSAGLRNAAANAALQTLLGVQEIEKAYYTAMSAVGTILSNAIAQLRATENACWEFIIKEVCASTPSGGKCSGKSGNQLKIATSTQFSQPIIDNQLKPLIETTANNLNVSQSALTLIGQLIAGVTNNSSVTAQRLAIQQLDLLVSQRRLHGQADLQQAQQSQSAVKSSVDILLQDTAKLWGDSTDVEKGWCNVKNSAVIDRWDRAWK